MAALARQAEIQGPYRLRCDRCPRERRCGQWDGRPVLGLRNWPRCPAAYFSDPIWTQVLRLHAAAQVAPLAEWPDGYAAWCERYLLRLEQGLQRKVAADTEVARKRAEAEAKWRADRSR